MGERERTDEVLGMETTPPGDVEILLSSLATQGAEPVELGGAAGPDADELLRLRLLSGTGARVGRFVIQGQLGEGGMGMVFAAHDEDLDRRVALKLLRTPPQRDPVGAARMRREAQALARLSHPNVVTVYEVGDFEGHVFIAMELVEGRTLKGWLRLAGRDARAIVRVFADAGRGLMAAHSAGIVHRDFKPSNVLVGADGRVIVLDFGIAQATARGQGPLTQAGTIAGTPAYMAPEQLAGGAVDPRADQYGLCVALFEALCGERPFKGITVVDRIRELVGQGPPAFPRAARVPRWLQQVVLRGLESDPDRRFPSMAALVTALERDPARTRRRALVGALVAGALVAGGYAIAHRGGGSAACAGEAEEVAALLDDGRRASLAAALADAGGEAGAATWERAGPALADRTQALSDRWRALCDARHAGEAVGESAHACLRRRRAALAALLAGLEEPDRAAIHGLIPAIDALPTAATCGPGVTPGDDPLPEDPVVAGEVMSLGERLEGARAALWLGRPAAGLATADDVIARAGALGQRALLGEARALEGALRAALGEREAAEGALREALWLADEGRDDRAVARALAGRLELRAAAAAAGEAAADDGDLRRHAEAVLRRLGDDEPAAIELRTAVGERLLAGGDPEAAREPLEAAVAGAAAAGLGEADPRALRALLGLSRAHAAAGEEAKARPLQEALVARQEARLGPAHPEVAAALRALAATLAAGARPEAAIDPLTRALAIDEAAFGAASERLGPTLAALAAAHERAGDPAAARPLRARALALDEARLGPEHPSLGPAHARVGALALALGDLAAGRRSTQAALAILEASGAGAAEVAGALLQLAAIERQDGRTSRGGAALERALRRCEAAADACPPALRAAIEAALADHLLAAGPRQRPRALALAEAALGRYRGLADPAYAGEIAALEALLAPPAAAAEAAEAAPAAKKSKRRAKKKRRR